MKHSVNSNRPTSPARRKALRRLAGAAISAYVVPEVLFLSAANAESVSGVSSASSASPASMVSPGSGVSGPSIVTPSGASSPEPSMPDPSGNAIEYDEESDACNLDGSPRSQGIRIARSDLNRSQDAIDAGYARPLEQIWSEFVGQYDGKVIGVEFTGRRANPRYKFRAISPSGRLETVVISAQTGDIIRISGC